MGVDDDYPGVIQFGIPLGISNGTGYIWTNISFNYRKNRWSSDMIRTVIWNQSELGSLNPHLLTVWPEASIWLSSASFFLALKER